MPISDSKSSFSKWRAEVLAHIALHGLTTPRALKRVVFAGDGALANDVVRSLIDDGSLFRRGDVLTQSRRAPSPTARHRARAVLSFCCHGTRLRPLLAPEQLAQLLGPILQHTAEPAPKSAHCVIDRDKRLSLVRVQPLVRDGQVLDLARELGRLQGFVESEAFRVWAYLASKSRFSITYLIESQQQAKELELWTTRRPLVSYALSAPVSVPLRAVYLPPM